MSDSVNVPVEALHAYGVESLVTTGMTDSDACIVADKLVLADSWGTFTHGNKLLGGYLKRLEAGGTDPLGQAQVASEGPAWTIVDGGNAMGKLAATSRCEKRSSWPIQPAWHSYVGVRNTNHFGAAGVYPAMAAEANMIGIAMANDIPSVCAPGSRQAIADQPAGLPVPAGSHPPILLDIATSTVAGGKVYAATQRGEDDPRRLGDRLRRQADHRRFALPT